MDDHQVGKISGVAIRTCGHTVLTADAHTVVLLDGAVAVVTMHSPRGAGGYTGWISAVVAGSRVMKITGSWEASALEGLDSPEEDTQGKVVLILAGYLTGLAAHTASLGVVESLVPHLWSSLRICVANPANYY